MKTRFSAITLALAAALPFPSPVSAADEPALEAVVVTATRQQRRAEDSLASVEVISREDIERAGHSSLVDVLQATPGVQVTANGGPGSNANVYIRGSEARHTLLLVDGIRVGSASSGSATFEAIPLAMIERIEILRGPASALYGSEAIGGVVQIFTRRGQRGFQPEVAVGYGSDNTFKGAVTLAGGVDRLRYSLSAGKERSDGYNAKRDPAYWRSGTRTSYWADDDGYRNDSASGSLSIGFRERDELGLNFTHSASRSWYDASALSYYDSYLDKTASTLGAHLRTQLSATWTSTLRLSQSEDKLLTRASAAAPSRSQTVQDQLGWQNDIDLPLGRLLLAYEHVETRLDSTTVYRENERRVNSLLAGWTADIDVHHLQINLRHDDNSQFGAKTTGLLAYGYDLTPEWRLRGSVATAFNAPTFNQLYWPMSSPTSYYGNPDLKPEEALNRELGLRWSRGAHMVELSYFDNKVKNLITNNPNPAQSGQQVNIGEARLKGLELGYTLALGGFNLGAGADFLDAKDEDTGLRLTRRARRSGFLRLSQTVDRFDWGIELNGAGRRYDNAANTVELHGYAILGAYAGYRIGRDWKVEVRGNNLLDKDYELARGYRTPGASAFINLRYAPR
ncbi:TonB-dependent receptor [Azoarcus indigens]|uniref:Vitamin B12 transporter n=1 Tax=Azoarcus indigens TaxID=29545 RepID=A0A4V3BN04_9RHOO|nr:TonB-dependent receptor [Azoarcus indigens]NMG64644.1 TonB-dependent receptor [Azoarcus indigens]TDN52472.1 vitamin B12 transporter [Azoarcus indigens]